MITAIIIADKSLNPADCLAVCGFIKGYSPADCLAVRGFIKGYSPADYSAVCGFIKKYEPRRLLGGALHYALFNWSCKTYFLFLMITAAASPAAAKAAGINATVTPV